MPESFLKGKYWGREEFREAAEKAAERTRKREGRTIPDNPEERIENYLLRFTDVFEQEDKDKQNKRIKALQRFLHRRFIIKPENISDEYIKGLLLGNYAEQKGYTREDLKDPNIRKTLIDQFRQETGEDFDSYDIPKERREEIEETVIQDQKTRLDSWLNYLTTSEAAQNYPSAYRYWAFTEMLKLGAYDDERKIYNKRTEKTAAPFPELDPQALSLVLDEIQRKQKKEPSQIIPTDEKTKKEFQKRLESENFNKLYSFFQEYLKSLRLPTERLFVTTGEWKVFPKGSDPKKVVKAIQGYHTQWCIAGEGTAGSYLDNSDLYIYFSQDKDGKNTIPRACIVHNPQKGVTEVRGIISDKNAKQHLDDYIAPIVEEKLKEIPGGERWQKQMKDMKRLAAIHIKYRQGKKLSKKDLRFLYEVDGEIESTGYGKDPRIEEILSNRDIKKDISYVLGNIKYHYGNLNLSYLKSPEGLELPESIGGNLNLLGLKSAEGLKLPESINGDLILSRLESAEGLKLPKSIGGYLVLPSLESAEGLKLPESINRGLNLSGLKSAKGLELPESIGGNLYLSGLKSAKGLKLPKSIGGSLSLSSLESPEGLELPESIGGDLDLSGLKSAKGLELPESIGGNLYLSGLKSAKGLKLPESINGDLILSRLESAEGLKLPKSIGGYLALNSLKSAKGLELPETIGDLGLHSLESAEGLKLPKSIGLLALNSLKSAKGLELPETTGYLGLNSLESAEGLKLPKSIGILKLGSLKSTKGLDLSKLSIGGYIYVPGNLISELRKKYPNLSDKIDLVDKVVSYDDYDDD